MPSYLEERGELVESEDTSFELEGTKYRISVSVRHKDRYRVYVALHKIRSTTPHDRLHHRRAAVSEKEDVQDRVEGYVKLMKQLAEEREHAKNLSVDVSVDT